jgi:hypothetical protein
MAFTYKLEQEDGTPADPPDIPHGRTYLGGGWHDPAGAQDAPRIEVREAADRPPGAGRGELREATH